MARKVVEVDAHGSRQHHGALVERHADLVDVPDVAARLGDEVVRLGGQAGGVHAQRVDARVRKDLAGEAGEVAVYAAQELVVCGEEGEVPG